jgi:hypothetical protein
MGDRSIVPAELGCFLGVDHVVFWCDTLPFRQFERAAAATSSKLARSDSSNDFSMLDESRFDKLFVGFELGACHLSDGIIHDLDASYPTSPRNQSLIGMSQPSTAL